MECEEIVGLEGVEDRKYRLLVVHEEGLPSIQKDYSRCFGDRLAFLGLFQALNVVSVFVLPDLDWKNFSGIPWETFGSEMEMVLLEVRFICPNFQFEKKESVKMVDFQH